MPAKLFDINDYIQEHRINTLLNESTTKEEKDEFLDVLNIVKEHFDEVNSSEELSEKEREKRQDLKHKAILGDKEAEIFFTGEIESYLREQNLLGSKYPEFFDSLSHAIYHELYRFGVFYKWEKFPESSSAKIRGKEIWFMVNGKFVKQKEELRNDLQIHEFFRSFQVGNKRLKINETNPEAEVEMQDGTRVTLITKPRVPIPTIVFRRYVVTNFSFIEQAKRGTIPISDTRFYEILSKLQLNMIIAGHVESGKSTMLKTVYASRNPELVAILIETSPETYLYRDFPDRLSHEFYVFQDDIETLIRTALRVDHHYVIFQEVRGYEAEGAIKLTERGRNGLLMTYHITDPANTPIQLAQHIVDSFPSRKIENEIRRIAKSLDIGITMETFKGNKKKVTSVYEICYDIKEDKAWINYLIKYNEHKDQWEYNANVSDQLKTKINKYDPQLAVEFLNHLQQMNMQFPMMQNARENVRI